MSGLQVRELPTPIYRKLAAEAEREHRSLAQQAVATIAKGLDMAEDPKARRQRILAKISSRARTTRVRDWANPVTMVREDRQR